MSFLRTLLTRIEDFLLPAERAAMSFFHAAIDSIVKNGGEVLTRAALAAVKAAQDTGGTGDEKFKAAKNAVVDSLLSQGAVATTNAIHLAIEAAVASLKSNADTH